MSEDNPRYIVCPTAQGFYVWDQHRASIVNPITGDDTRGLWRRPSFASAKAAAERLNEAIRAALPPPPEDTRHD